MRHFDTSGIGRAPDVGECGLDLLSPLWQLLWQLLDLTPSGRGSWNPSIACGP